MTIGKPIVKWEAPIITPRTTRSGNAWAAYEEKMLYISKHKNPDTDNWALIRESASSGWVSELRNKFPDYEVVSNALPKKLGLSKTTFHYKVFARYRGDDAAWVTQNMRELKKRKEARSRANATFKEKKMAGDSSAPPAVRAATPATPLLLNPSALR